MSNSPPTHEHDARRAAQGVLCGIGAYGWWGLIPLYFRLVREAAPLEILAQRVVWSFLLLALVIAVTRRFGDVRRAFASPSVMRILAASTALIAVNWFTYIYAVTSEQVIQASLGYFITPLANVLLGIAVLGERLRVPQAVALGLAGVGVVILAVLGGEVPWISLALAASFSTYGLLRKMVAVDGLLGLFIETLLLAPAALACAAWLSTVGDGVFGHDVKLSWLIALGGPVTTAPLLMFAAAARRLQLTTLGFLQYLAPTLQFLVAVFLFDEPFTRIQLVSFAFIWAAVVLYSIDSLHTYRRRRSDARQRLAPTEAEVDADALV